MKRILLAVLSSLIAVSAHATIIMYAQNQNGGRIELTDMSCNQITGFPNLSKLEGMMSMIIDSAGEPVDIGCYSYQEPNFSVTWSNGLMRFYDPSGMTLTTAGKNLFEQARKASY